MTEYPIEKREWVLRQEGEKNCKYNCYYFMNSMSDNERYKLKGELTEFILVSCWANLPLG